MTRTMHSEPIQSEEPSHAPPPFRLPPFKVEQVMAVKSQIVDWGLEMLGIPTFWKTTKGEGIRVAVLDTGCAPNHPDLREAILDAEDFTASPFGWADGNGHGTHVCGIIAAQDDAAGVVGVAPKARLLVGKVLNDQGSGGSHGIVRGIRWAVERRADVISMSLGSPVPDPLIGQAVKEALQAGVFVVAAAGNEGPDLDTVGYPAGFPGVISVARFEVEELTMVIGGEKRTIVVENQPRFSAMYELESPEVLVSDPWAKAVDQGRWPGQVRPYTRNRRHVLYRRLSP